MTTPAPSRVQALPLLLILGIAAACLAVSTQSLWIDELESAMIVLRPTLADCWRALDADHSSNMQLPLYFLYLRAWSRVFGGSELVLRAANLPWFFLGFFSIVHFLRRHTRLRDVTLLVFCVHPFVWYYLNEVRPYAMELGGAMLLCGALFAALDRRDEPLSVSWWWCYGAGLVILCGSTVVGVPWAATITTLLLTLPAFRHSVRRSLLPALIFVPLLALLAVYFVWTFKEKVRNAILPTTVLSAASVFYELLGFLGLGPARNDLRVNALAATRGFLLPLTCLAVPLGAGLLLAVRRRFCLKTGDFIALLLVTGFPTALTFALGVKRQARMLARHFSPLFPFILMAEVCAVILLWRSGRIVGRFAAGLIVVCLACSSLEARFAARHARDDYRSAAAAAHEALAQQKTVWWAGERMGAEYYHIPIDNTERPGAVLLTYGVPKHFASPPDEIILSKPDLFDGDGSLASYISAHHYIQTARWQSFTIWQKPPPGA